jgi:hypothetical protein
MGIDYKPHYDQLVGRRESVCEIRMDADRITLTLDRVYPKALARVAEEMENMQLCRYTVVEDNKIFLMQPDYGMFGDDEEFREIVSELFEEENYGIIYID